MGRHKKSKFWDFSSSKTVYGGSYGDDLFSTGSDTGWEKSHFGGFERPVWDYPSVSLSNDIEIKPGEIKGKWHGEFFREKVVKIFLSKAKSRKIVDHIWSGASVQKVTVGSFFNTQPALAYIATKEAITEVFETVRDKESELKELFNHYKDVIVDSTIQVIIPERECKGGKPGQKGKPGEKGEKSESTESGGGSPDDSGEKDAEVPEMVTAAMIESISKATDSASAYKHAMRTMVAPLLEKAFKGEPLTEDQQDTLNQYMKAVTRKYMDDLKEIDFSSKSKVSSFKKTPVAVIQKPNSQETVYEHEEITTSEMLVNMLDISFESKSDEIKNLKLGKMDLSKLGEVPAGNFHIYKQTVEDQDTRPFSIAILGDESGSMSSNGRISSQYSLIKTLFRAFSAILPQDKIWVYGHSGDTSPELFVYHEPSEPNFLTTIDNMKKHRLAQNYDGPIIEFVHKRIREKTTDRILFIVLSDGTPSGHGYGTAEDHIEFKRIMEKCKRDDFIVCGVMIQINNGRHLYSYSTRVDKMDEMPKKVSNLLNKVVKTEFQ